MQFPEFEITQVNSIHAGLFYSYYVHRVRINLVKIQFTRLISFSSILLHFLKIKGFSFVIQYNHIGIIVFLDEKENIFRSERSIKFPFIVCINLFLDRRCVLINNAIDATRVSILVYEKMKFKKVPIKCTPFKLRICCQFYNSYL